MTGYQISRSDPNDDRTPYECRTTTIYHHYAKGADWWGTPSVSLANLFSAIRSKGDFAKVMDQGPANDAIGFILGYFSNKNTEGKRKRFPALFTIYFSGLDHEAHSAGMGGYSDFFRNITDPQIKLVLDFLKQEGEFDNKIFIIVSDHGMTAMPTFGKITLYPGTEDEREVIPDTSCELKVDNFNKREVQDSEKTNNNLHIWELAELFRIVGDKIELNYKVLAPEPVAKLFKDLGDQEPLYGATSNVNQANVTVGLNGPMAHVYLRGNNWRETPAQAELGYLALVFKRMLQEDGANLGEDILNKVESKIPRLLQSVDEILIRIDGAYKIFKGVDDAGNPVADELTVLDNYDYVKTIKRIEGLNHAMRGGDIILIMRDKIPEGVGQRYSTGTACKAWHGSLNRSDSFVPLIAAYPGGNQGELKPIIENTEGCSVAEGCDGNWRTKNLIMEIINRQYLER